MFPVIQKRRWQQLTTWCTRLYGLGMEPQALLKFPSHNHDQAPLPRSYFANWPPLNGLRTAMEFPWTDGKFLELTVMLQVPMKMA